MISGGGQQFEKKARSLGAGALSAEDIHGAAYMALYRFFGRNNFFQHIGFEHMTWVIVTCFLCAGVLGFSWFFFFGLYLQDPATLMAFNVTSPLEIF